MNTLALNLGIFRIHFRFNRIIYKQILVIIILLMLIAEVLLLLDIGLIYNARERARIQQRDASVISAYIVSQIPAVSINAANAKLAHEATVEKNRWKGPVLSKRKGTIQGPSGKETYYNLNMSVIVRMMKRRGFDYEYWVRDDGVKMFGDYVMVAANLDRHPRGSLVETSLGTGIVCDTGGFAKRNPTQLDIATTW